MINLFFKSVTFYGEYVILTSKKHHSQHMLSFLLPVIQVTYLSEKWMLLIFFHWYLIILLAKELWWLRHFHHLRFLSMGWKVSLCVYNPRTYFNTSSLCTLRVLKADR